MLLLGVTGEQMGSLSALLFLAISCNIDVYPTRRYPTKLQKKGRRCLQLFGDIEDDFRTNRSQGLEVLYKILYTRSSLSE